MMDALGFQIETKPTLEPWRTVLLDAADYIEKHGFMQGGGGCGKNGERCAGVAIVEARERLGEGTSEAMRRFTNFMGFSSTAGIPRWNDTPGRTASEVIAALRECARS